MSKAAGWVTLWVGLPLALTVAGKASPRAVAAEAAADDPALERAANDFRRRDADRDRQLSLAELLANQPEATLSRLRQQFIVLDFDDDKALSWDEFRNLSAPVRERGNVPDPIVDLKRRVFQQWEAIFAAADHDRSHGLSAREWPAQALAEELPALAEVSFKSWDADGNGEVDQAESRRLFEVAYGLARPSGMPLRTSAGTVLVWYYTRRLDKDHDGMLSRDEFVAGHSQGKEKNAEIFGQRDANHDDRLDDEEMAPLFWTDSLTAFYAYDSDRDGAVSAAELDKAWSWGAGVRRRVPGAFDDDGDGALSFMEFRATPFANQVSNWWQPRTDANHDGRLSWQEFYLEESPVMIGLSRFMFDRFDLDDDGFLSFKEFEFSVDFRLRPPEAAFKEIDENDDGFVSESELAVRTARPAAEIQRDFKLFDRDADGRFDLSEFSTLPTVVAVHQRGKMPDPFVKLVDRYVALVDKHWDDWDADANGELSLAEFNLGTIDSFRLPNAVLQIGADSNGDAIIAREEARGLMELLLGVQYPASQLRIFAAPAAANGGVRVVRGKRQRADLPLRLPGGAVVNLVQFRNLDRNRSESIDRAEFDVLNLPVASRAAQFASCDRDGDGQISLEEWTRAPLGLYDPANEFRNLDANLDAFVDREELLKVALGRQNVAKQIFPGFDLDGDGQLSLAEFRFTPLANPLVNWFAEIRDTDGKLTFDEFPGATEPFALLRWHALERFDLNSDGTLDTDEFYFRVRLPNAFYTLNSDGTGWAKLFELEGYPAGGSPMVSPDGKTLAFDAWQVLDNGGQGPPTVFFVNIDGTDCREICQGQMPTWSPDGKLFSCSRTEGGFSIAIMTLDGQVHQGINNGWSAQWSPDGKKIAYYQGNRLMVYDVETGQSSDVLGAANAYQQIFWNMCWSPDSKQICFKAVRGDGKSDLVLVDAAGADKGLKVRFTAAAFNPKFAWHPTQSRIVFPMSCPERRAVQLYEFDPKTDEPPALVPGQDPERNNGDPCWTPDGKRLIVTHGGF